LPRRAAAKLLIPNVMAGLLVRSLGRSLLPPGFSAWRMQGRQRETDGHACAELVDRMTVRQSVARPDIEGQVLANLPDQADEAGHGF
jgi:hypothetical protein